MMLLDEEYGGLRDVILVILVKVHSNLIGFIFLIRWVVHTYTITNVDSYG